MTTNKHAPDSQGALDFCFRPRHQFHIVQEKPRKTRKARLTPRLRTGCSFFHNFPCPSVAILISTKTESIRAREGKSLENPEFDSQYSLKKFEKRGPQAHLDPPPRKRYGPAPLRPCRFESISRFRIVSISLSRARAGSPSRCAAHVSIHPQSRLPLNLARLGSLGGREPRQ